MISDDEPDDEKTAFQLDLQPPKELEELAEAHEQLMHDLGEFQIIGKPIEHELLRQLLGRKDNLGSELMLKYIVELKFSINHVSSIIRHHEDLFLKHNIEFETAFERKEESE
jgi:hypothetical protein